MCAAKEPPTTVPEVVEFVDVLAVAKNPQLSANFATFNTWLGNAGGRGCWPSHAGVRWLLH